MSLCCGAGCFGASLFFFQYAASVFFNVPDGFPAELAGTVPAVALWAVAWPTGVATLYASATSARGIPADVIEKRRQLATVQRHEQRLNHEIAEALGSEAQITMKDGGDEIHIATSSTIADVLTEDPRAYDGPLGHYLAQLEAGRFTQRAEALKSKLKAARELHEEKRSLVSELTAYQELPAQIVEEQRERTRARASADLEHQASMEELRVRKQQAETALAREQEKREAATPKELPILVEEEAAKAAARRAATKTQMDEWMRQHADREAARKELVKEYGDEEGERLFRQMAVDIFGDEEGS